MEDLKIGGHYAGTRVSHFVLAHRGKGLHSLHLHKLLRYSTPFNKDHPCDDNLSDRLWPLVPSLLSLRSSASLLYLPHCPARSPT